MVIVVILNFWRNYLIITENDIDKVFTSKNGCNTVKVISVQKDGFTGKRIDSSSGFGIGSLSSRWSRDHPWKRVKFYETKLWKLLNE